ncbi:hypothetical protein RRG08_025252 [Elysia crispata]|uniref:Uncharacterized protein n=1 Tax=Elysia crispata TaxID=231223 RepID=A0AAE1AA27_9GAST|nr:hypothetical protein RRG08_025252 [Elysia crispata]
MSEGVNQGFSHHKEALSNYEAKIPPGKSPTEQGNDQFSELHVNDRGITCGPANKFFDQITSNDLLSKPTSSKSIFPHISELVPPPQSCETLIYDIDKFDSGQATNETNGPPQQDSFQNVSVQQNDDDPTSNVRLMPYQPRRLYSWSQSHFPPSAPQIQWSGKTDSQYNLALSSMPQYNLALSSMPQYNLALSSMPQDNQQNKTNPMDCNTSKPTNGNSSLHTPLNMQNHGTGVTSNESCFKIGANDDSRHVGMPSDVSGLMPTQKGIYQLNTLPKNLNQNKAVKYPNKRPKMPKNMLLSYILSLAHQCSVFLIPLDEFESSMTSSIERCSRLILHYSDYFKHIVNVMMTELAKQHSPQLFPWQVDPPQDLIAWGDFKIPRDRFGRQQERSSLSTQFTNNEIMNWTCFFKAAVTGLCKKMQNKMDGTNKGLPILPDTPHLYNQSAMLQQYIGPYSRFPPPVENDIIERSSGYFSGPLQGVASNDFKHNIRDSHLANLSNTANNDSESLHKVSRLGTVSMGCTPMLPPYLRNEKQIVHTDNFSMNPQVAYSSSLKNPGPNSAKNRWEYSTTAGQVTRCVEQQNKENIPIGAAGGSSHKNYMPLVNFLDEAQISSSEKGKEKTRLDPKNPPKEQCRCKHVGAFNKMFTQPTGDIVDLRLSPSGTRRISYNHQTAYKVLYERNSEGYVDIYIKQPSGYMDIISTEPSGKTNIFFKRKVEEMRDFCMRHPSSLNSHHRNLLDNRADKVGFSNTEKKF